MGKSSFATTKLAIPRGVRTEVPRPHLVEQLSQPWYRIGLVSAPAGFGKTAVLARWAAEQHDPVAWLSCDVTDGEPAQFWRGLLAALGARCPGVGDDAAVLLDRAGGDSHELAISLANDLQELQAPIIVVVDDFHLAAPTPAVFAQLAAAMPATVRLVLGTRTDPPLPWARMRVAGTLLELRGDDLSFAPGETAAVLQANDIGLDPGETARLHDLTEGWPAGVQLGALALQRASDRSGFLDSFVSTDRAVSDFLVSEVLDRQPAELVEFLHDTALLDEFDVALCEAVAAPEHAARLLDQLVAANLFVVRVDVGGGWYRYHHLFGAFLRARLRALGQPRWRAAHERAARALEARGDIAGAFRHAAASGDPEQAAAITRRTLARWIGIVDPDATLAAVRQWLHQQGRQLIESDPAQVLDYLLILVTTTNPDDAVWWLEQIEAAHPDASPTLTGRLQGTWAEHHLSRGDADEALRRARVAMDAVGRRPPPHGALPALPVVLVRAQLQAGDLAGAEADLALLEANRTGHPVIDDVRAPALRAWVAYLEGEFRRAEAQAVVALAAAEEMKVPSSDVGRIFAGLTTATLLIERDEDGAARQLLDQLRQDVDLGRRPSLQSVVTLQQARHALLLGDEESAEAELNRARLLLPNACPSVRSLFDLEAARQALQFRPWTANSLIDALDSSPSATLLRVRLALADGDHRAAAAFLDQVPAPCTRRERIVRALLVAQTLVHHDVDAANTELSAVLAEASQEGFHRTIHGAGPDLVKLLLSCTPTPALESYVSELIDAATSVAAPVRPAANLSLVDPLSDREVTVLRYLCSRLTYQEIASALYVSRNTVKSHTASVFRKLGVSSRREAVEEGRRLRIV